MDIEKVKELIRHKRYDEALEMCKALKEQSPELRVEAIRQASHVYSRKADYESATRQLAQLLETGEGTLADYDSAAFWALFDGQLAQSLAWYLTALEIGQKENVSWFRSNQLCLISYIYFELGEFERALSYLEMLETDDEQSGFLIPLPAEGILGECQVKELRHQILIRLGT